VATRSFETPRYARLLRMRRRTRHPFEIGSEAVSRYFKVTDECAQVARLKLLRAGKG
jgi:hypothetical protein